MLRRVVLPIAIVAALGLLAWRLWPIDVGVEPAVATGPQPTRGESTPALQPPAHDPETPDDRFEVAAPGDPPPPATTEAARRRVWLVRGRVTGAPTDPVEEARVSAHLLGPYNIPDSVEGPIRPDGTFELDVTGPVEAWLRHIAPVELVVTADHPDCLPSEIRVPFTSGAIERGSADVERTVFRCDFELASAAVVTGRVIVPADWTPPHERGEVERPRVGLFERVDREPGERAGLDFATCDEQGGWRLRAPRGGSFVVVALAEGLRPQAQAVELILGRVLEIDPLELSRGAWIAGRVGRGGRMVGAGARVGARRVDARGPTLTFPPTTRGWARLTWIDGGPERTDLDAATLEDGSYRLEGLAAADHEVWIDSLPGLRVRMGGRHHPERVVRAPADGVDLEGVPSCIDLTLRVDGQPPTRAQLEGVVADLVPEEPDLRSFALDLLSNDGDFGRIQVETGVGYTLSVRPGRYASRPLDVAPLAAGDVAALTLDLESAALESTLVLRLLTDDSEPVDALELWLREAGQEELDYTRRRTCERDEDGLFRCEGLSPGSYRVLVRPRAELASGDRGHHVETEIDVALPAATVVEREVTLQLGGRVRMCATDEEGGSLRAAVELRDARGERIPTDFYCNVQGMSYGCGWYLCEQGLNDHPPLPAGRYEFTLTCEGFEREVRTVDLQAGQTQTIEVVLRRP